jgi:hypothetical protein
MNKLVAVLAFAVAGNAFAASQAQQQQAAPAAQQRQQQQARPMAPAQQMQQAPAASQAPGVVRAAGALLDAAGNLVVETGRAAGQVAGAAVEFVGNTGTVCTLPYEKVNAHVIMVGGSIGGGVITCDNGFGSPTSTRVDMVEVNFGPGFEISREKGVITLYGVGTSSDVFLGAFATANVRLAWGQGGRAAGVQAGATVGTTGGQLLAGYLWSDDIQGLGASATIGVRAIADSRIRETVVGLFHGSAPSQGGGQQQQQQRQAR